MILDGAWRILGRYWPDEIEPRARAIEDSRIGDVICLTGGTRSRGRNAGNRSVVEADSRRARDAERVADRP